MTAEALVWLFIGIAVLANTVVSVLVIRSRYYSARQKTVQCLLVWLLPVLGATAFWAFLRTQEHQEVFNTRAYPEPAERMVAAEIQNAIHDTFGGGAHGGGGGGND